tara:strand:+ start:435 stop:656 length:222 start_codon:yes stop_codon:yes gene_type:complete
MNPMRCPLCYGEGILDPIAISQPITQHIIRYTNLLNKNTEMLRELSILRDMNTTRKRGGKRRKRKRTLKKKKK